MMSKNKGGRYKQIVLLIYMNGFNYRMEIGNSNITLGRGLLRTVKDFFHGRRSLSSTSLRMCNYILCPKMSNSFQPLWGENSSQDAISESPISRHYFSAQLILVAVGLGKRYLKVNLILNLKF